MLHNNPLFRRLFACCAIIAGVLVLGTAGYMAIEGWSLNDGFYMSVITLSTVGFGETRELTQLGRLFTAGLIFISVAGLSIWTASLTSLIIEGDLSGGFRKQKAKKMAQQMNQHTIVCGSGLMAQAVIAELLAKKIPLVVVDDDVNELQGLRLKYPQLPIIEASPVDELSLFDANVLAAKHLVAAVNSDFDNLLIAMTCIDLGTKLKIVARSNDLRIARRMMKAGVDEVICPFQLSGEHAARLIAG